MLGLISIFGACSSANQSADIDLFNIRADVPCMRIPACSLKNDSYVTANPFFNDRLETGCQETMDAICNDPVRNELCLSWLASDYGKDALPLTAKRSFGCTKHSNCTGPNATLEWRCWSNHSTDPNAYCGKDHPSPSSELRAAFDACPASLAQQQTAVRLCHFPNGLFVATNATDADIFSTAQRCNGPTFAMGDVLEVFVAAVPSPLDNPSWYLELDTGSTGVMWGALTYNPETAPWNAKTAHKGGNYIIPRAALAIATSTSTPVVLRGALKTGCRHASSTVVGSHSFPREQLPT